MSNVYGRKVKEPKVTATGRVKFRRSRADKQADDLHQAWAEFGEAKGMLQQLEKRLSSASPSHFAHSSPLKSEDRNTKFGTSSEDPISPRSPRSGGNHRHSSVNVEDLENSRTRGNYTLEPAMLNKDARYYHEEYLEDETQRPNTNSREYLTSKRSSMQFTPSPAGSYFPADKASSSRTVSLAPTSQSGIHHGTEPSAFSPNLTGHVSSTHSVRGAVFSKPVATGKTRGVLREGGRHYLEEKKKKPLLEGGRSLLDGQRSLLEGSRPLLEGSRPSMEGSEHSLPYPDPRPSYSMNSSASSLSHAPVPTIPILVTSTSQSDPVWTSQAEKLQTSDMPNSLSSLKASVAEQKKVMEEMGKKIRSYRMSAASGGSGTASGRKPGFYALSEAKDHPLSTKFGPSHGLSRDNANEEYLASKKRKVAPAAPPTAYAGFSSKDSLPSYRPQLPGESVSREKFPAGTAGTAGTGGTEYVFSHSRPKYTGSATVRKVHRFGPGESAQTGGIITPSSWRAGKDLADKVLRESASRRDPKADNRDDFLSRHRPSLSKRSPPSLSPSPRGRRFSSPSCLTQDSLEDKYRPLAAGRDDYTDRESVEMRESDSESETTKETGSNLSSEQDAGHPRAAKLSADMTRLLEELQSTSREIKKSYERAGSKVGVAPGKGSREKATFAGPAAKKSKYEPEPTAEKVRHYNQPEVQQYILEKREERRRKAQQEQELQKKETRLREAKLRQLYETQRRRVEANLKLKEKQKSLLLRAEQAAADVQALTSGLQYGIPKTRSEPDPPHIVVESPTSPSPPQSSKDSLPYLQASHSASPSVQHPSSARPHPSPPTSSAPSSRRVLSYSTSYSEAKDASIGHRVEALSQSYNISPPSAGYTLSSVLSGQRREQSPSRISRSTQGQPVNSSRAFYVTMTSPGGATPTTTCVPPLLSYPAHLSRFGTMASATPHTTTPTTTTAVGYSGSPISAVKRSGYTPSLAVTEGQRLSSQQKSREERIQAITAAALNLKERILEQSRKLSGSLSQESGVGDENPLASRDRSPLSSRDKFLSPRDRSPPAKGGEAYGSRQLYQLNTSGLSAEEDLPGVKNLQQQAALTEKLRREGAAATHIQAAYRGYSVRKSLKWQLPAGDTLGGALQGSRKRGDGVEEYVGSKGVALASTDGDSAKGKTGGGARDSRSATPTNTPDIAAGWDWLHHRQQAGVEAAATSTELWNRRTGGDVHSVINIYTRQHKGTLLREDTSTGARRQQDSLTPLAAPQTGAFQTYSPTSQAAPQARVSQTFSQAAPRARVSSTYSPASSQQQQSLYRPTTASEHTQDYSYSQVFEPPSTSMRSHSTIPKHSSPKNEREKEGVSSSLFSESESYSPLPQQGKKSNSMSDSLQVTRESSASISQEQSFTKAGQEYEDSITSAASSTVNLTSAVTPPHRSDYKYSHLSRATPRAKSSLSHSDASASGSAVLSGVISPEHSPVEEKRSASFSGKNLTPTLPKPPQSSAQEQSPKSADAITPPGSTSFVDYYAPPPKVSGVAYKADEHRRVPPHLLEQQLHTELEKLENVESTMQQLTQVEMTQALSTAQVQATALAGLLKNREEAHRRELQNMQSSMVPSDAHVPAMLSESTQETEREKKAQSGIDHVPSDSGQPFSVTEDIELPVDTSDPTILEADQKGQDLYSSDFEPGTSSALVPPTDDSLTTHNVSQPPLTESPSERDGTPLGIQRSSATTLQEQSRSDLAPPTEMEESSRSSSEFEGTSVPDDTPKATVRGSDSEVEEEFSNGDVSEVSFREVLPSESHRRQQKQTSKQIMSHLHVTSHRTRHDSSDLDEKPSSPSLAGTSRAATPSMSEASMFSSHGGEDTFFAFTSRMVRMYVKEEEVRARHQSTLLQLRLQALQERTKAELEWLKVQQRDLQSKGADDQMPPLKKREQGVLKKLKQEEEEIKTLKQAHEAASQERKLMMLQQKEISKMRRSTEYYRHKIQRYRQHSRASLSPEPTSLLGHESSSVAEGPSDVERSLRDTTPVSKAKSSPISSASLKLTTSTPLVTESESLKNLRKVSSQDAARYLSQREHRLGKQRERKAVEKAIQQQQKLLKENEDGESTSPQHQSKLLSPPKRSTKLKNAEVKLSKSAAGVGGRAINTKHSADDVTTGEVQSMTSPQSVSEAISMSNASQLSAIKHESRTSIPEVVSSDLDATLTSREKTTTSDYTQDNFEPLDSTLTSAQHPPPVTTSTPMSATPTPATSMEATPTPGTSIPATSMEATPTSATAMPATSMEATPTSATSMAATPTVLKDSSFKSQAVFTQTGAQLREEEDEEHSVTDSITEAATVTSDGSAIEARIRTLQLQLRQRQREMQQAKNEQNRRRKALLKQKEEKLKKKLEVVESEVKKIKSAPILRDRKSESFSHSPSPSEEEGEVSSKEMSPHYYSHSLTGHARSPSLEDAAKMRVKMRDLKGPITDNIQLRKSPPPSPGKWGVSPSPPPPKSAFEEEPASPHQQQLGVPYSSYTSFTESMESRVSEVISSATDREREQFTRSPSFPDEDLEGDRGDFGDDQFPPSGVSDTKPPLSASNQRPSYEGYSMSYEAITPEDSMAEDSSQYEDPEQIGDQHGLATMPSPSLSQHSSPQSHEESAQIGNLASRPSPSSSQQSHELATQIGSRHSPSLSQRSHEEFVQIKSLARKPSPPLSQHFDEGPVVSGESMMEEPVVSSYEAVSEEPEEPSDLERSASASPSAHPLPLERPRSDSERSDSGSTLAAQSQGGDYADMERFDIGQHVLIANKVRGVVRYVGPTIFAPGIWIGIEITVPKGRNDGSVNGKRYFSCEPNYGVFVPPRKLTIVSGPDESVEEEIEEDLKEQEEDLLQKDAKEPLEVVKKHREQAKDLEVEKQKEQIQALEEEFKAQEEKERELVKKQMEQAKYLEEKEKEQLKALEEEERALVKKQEEQAKDLEEKLQKEAVQKQEEQAKVKKQKKLLVHALEEKFKEQKEEERELVRKQEEQVKEKFKQHKEGMREPKKVVKEQKEDLEQKRANDQQKEEVRKQEENVETTKELAGRGMKFDVPESELSRIVEEGNRGIEKVPYKHFATPSSEKVSVVRETPGSTTIGKDLTTEESSVSQPEVSYTSSEIPAPASTVELGTRGQKPDGLPLAPEVPPLRSQSATPTPAPPPEFAEGASRESSIEPPVLSTDVRKTTTTPSPADKKRMVSERMSDELVQDMANEAYEVMHKIWQSKHQEETEKAIEETVKSRHKHIKSLDEKAEKITDELFPMLLKAETAVACDIHASKKALMVDKNEEQDEEEQLEAQSEDKLTSLSSEVLDRSPSAKHTLPHLSLNTGILTPLSDTNIPPPLSPPSPYRSSHSLGLGTSSVAITHVAATTASPSPTEFSPPGSPPRHLPQSSAARVAAGERSPFSAHPDAQAMKNPGPSRSSSTESLINLLDTMTTKTAHCMVPSERENVNKIVESAFEEAVHIGFQNLKPTDTECPKKILDLFNSLREMSDEEERCQTSYIQLIYRLTLETISALCPQKKDVPIWEGNSAVRSLLAPAHFPNDNVTVEEVQKRVFAALMRGQLPNQLPNIKFLHKMKRPGGKDIDFVDQVLIRELRNEEPGWVDYSKDEVSVKEKTADALLESLIDETVGVLKAIRKKKKAREQARK